MDGEEPDEDGYPSAPMPRHERAWRHPSEVGDAVWQRSEPPLTIGRGLLLTTGAIGGLLALAVLWTTLPTNAGSSVSAITTEALGQVRSLGSGRDPDVSELADSQTASVTTTLLNVVSTTGVPRRRPTTTLSPAQVSVSATAAPRPTSVPASSNRPTSTVPVRPAPSSLPGGSPGGSATMIHISSSTIDERVAVAVVVGGSAMVLTTAGSIDADDTITLSTGDGRIGSAKVAMIYRGVAVLEPDAAIDGAIPMARRPHAGEVVTVLGGSRTDVTLDSRADGSVGIDSWGDVDVDVPEGSPIVNHDGELVGLCRHGTAGPELVVIDAEMIAATSPASSTTSTSATSTSGPTPDDTTSAIPTPTPTPTSTSPEDPPTTG